MSTIKIQPSSELAILGRVVNRKRAALSREAAKALLQLDFDAADRRRMNLLAAKNRARHLTSAEEEELDNFIRVGQVLGVLKSKARQALKHGHSQAKTP